MFHNYLSKIIDDRNVQMISPSVTSSFTTPSIYWCFRMLNKMWRFNRLIIRRHFLFPQKRHLTRDHGASFSFSTRERAKNSAYPLDIFSTNGQLFDPVTIYQKKQHVFSVACLTFREGGLLTTFLQIIFGNSEAKASELLENLKDMYSVLIDSAQIIVL